MYAVKTTTREPQEGSPIDTSPIRRRTKPVSHVG
jgi:hypothetical protein